MEIVIQFFCFMFLCMFFGGLFRSFFEMFKS